MAMTHEQQIAVLDARLTIMEETITHNIGGPTSDKLNELKHQVADLAAKLDQLLARPVAPSASVPVEPAPAQPVVAPAQPVVTAPAAPQTPPPATSAEEQVRGKTFGQLVAEARARQDKKS